ncbi:hypothetical protein HF563_14605 [Acidithiobacillus ferridurans]|nr:hypothetical protein [Acidithiobacillus ferridurans]
MNKSNFEMQLAANFVASEIRKSGQNVFERLRALKEIYAREEFAMPDLTEVLDPAWLSPEQIQAEAEAAGAEKMVKKQVSKAA